MPETSLKLLFVTCENEIFDKFSSHLQTRKTLSKCKTMSHKLGVKCSTGTYTLQYILMFSINLLQIPKRQQTTQDLISRKVLRI